MKLPRIIQDIELRLADFYGFAPKSGANGHLVSQDELRQSLGERVATLPEFNARGGVFLVDGEGPGDLFIGIHLSDDVRLALEAADPTTRLDGQNLDAFCVLVEEISHFHLIVNRVQRAQPVTKLELEWQGEIDKLLISALTLQDQQGDCHLELLARKLFDEAVIVSADEELYWEATRHAARFWFDAARAHEPLGAKTRELLRHTYRAPWADKLASLDAVKRAS